MVTLWAAKKDSTLYGAYEHMIAAAWLHDVLEDTKLTDGDVHAAVGKHVTDLVVELTNASTGSKEPRAVRKAKDREKLARASREAKIIKMFDRIDNLMDLAPDDSFGIKYAEESILLADAIGGADGGVKAELVAACKRVLRRHEGL